MGPPMLPFLPQERRWCLSDEAATACWALRRGRGRRPVPRGLDPPALPSPSLPCVCLCVCLCLLCLCLSPPPPPPPPPHALSLIVIARPVALPVAASLPSAFHPRRLSSSFPPIQPSPGPHPSAHHRYALLPRRPRDPRLAPPAHSHPHPQPHPDGTLNPLLDHALLAHLLTSARVSSRGTCLPCLPLASSAAPPSALGAPACAVARARQSASTKLAARPVATAQRACTSAICPRSPWLTTTARARPAMPPPIVHRASLCQAPARPRVRAGRPLLLLVPVLALVPQVAPLHPVPSTSKYLALTSAFRSSPSPLDQPRR